MPVKALLWTIYVWCNSLFHVSRGLRDSKECKGSIWKDSGYRERSTKTENTPSLILIGNHQNLRDSRSIVENAQRRLSTLDSLIFVTFWLGCYKTRIKILRADKRIDCDLNWNVFALNAMLFILKINRCRDFWQLSTCCINQRFYAGTFGLYESVLVNNSYIIYIREKPESGHGRDLAVTLFWSAS